MSSESIHKRSAELTLIEVKENGFISVADPQACYDKVKKYTGVELEIDGHILKFKQDEIHKI